MRTSSIIALCVVFILLLGYIFLFERHAPDSDLKRELEIRVFPKLKRDRIDRLVINRQGEEPLILSCSSDTWRILSPEKRRAEKSAVQSLLSAVEFAEVVRSAFKVKNSRQLGLNPPQALLEISQDSERLRIEIGRIDSSGLGVYIRRANQLLVADRELFEAINQPAEAFFARDLVPISETALQRIIVKNNADSFEIRPKTRGWLISQKGREVRAASAPTDRLVGNLLNLRAQRFLDKLKKLPSPKVLIVGKTKQVELRLGRVCPGRPEETVVAGREENAWYWACVDKDKVNFLFGTGEQLQDKGLTDMTDIELAEISIQRANEHLHLKREAGAWRFSDGKEADFETVRRFVDTLRSFRGELVFVDNQTLAALNLQGKYTRQIALQTENGAREVLFFVPPVATHPAHPRQIPVRRDHERAILWVPKEAAAMLETDPLSFRNRVILEISPYLITKLTTLRNNHAHSQKKAPSDLITGQQGMEIEEIVKRDKSWRLVRPIPIEADTVHMQKVLQLLSRLRVKAFTSKNISGEKFSILVEFMPQEPTAKGNSEKPLVRKRLDLGLPERFGDCIGRQDQGPGFILDRESCLLLYQRRARRTLVSLNEKRLEQIKLVLHKHLLNLEKRGPSWYSGENQVEAQQVRGIIDILKNLKAESIEYQVHPLVPFCEVSLFYEAQKPQHILIGKLGKAQVKGMSLTYFLAPKMVENVTNLLHP